MFEFHSGIQDATGSRTFSCLLSHAQLTTATQCTLSYICGRGFTGIYTRREEIPEDSSGDEIKIVDTHWRYSRKNTRKETERTMTYETGGHILSPHTRSICTHQMMSICKRITHFCEQERSWPIHPGSREIRFWAFSVFLSIYVCVSIFMMIIAN